MSLQVTAGAQIQCTFGVAPSVLVALPEGTPVLANGLPAATIMDFVPLENIPTFGMCTSPANPEVITATAAAAGVLTPMPCVPVTTSPWIPGSPTVLINGMPALTEICTCICDWGGVITIGVPGQETVLTSDV
ncbi:MAG TPA: DUF4280 domain-containing protein [Acidimicrobiales bacterium]|nr:DUF4280 domain-containing protein [Acidimicrobiales bacterium]